MGRNQGDNMQLKDWISEDCWHKGFNGAVEEGAF